LNANKYPIEHLRVYKKVELSSETLLPD